MTIIDFTVGLIMSIVGGLILGLVQGLAIEVHWIYALGVFLLVPYMVGCTYIIDRM